MTAAEPTAARGAIRLRVSARMRILGWIALLLVVAGVIALLLQRRLLLDRLDAEIETALPEEAMELRVLANGRDPETGEPFAGDVTAIFHTFMERNIPEEGEVFLSFVGGVADRATISPYALGEDPLLVERWADLTATDRGEVSTPAGPLRFLAVPLAADDDVRGVFVVGNFMRDELDEIDRATQIGFVVYGSVLLVALGLAWLVAGRVLRPVRDVIAAAKMITDTDLARRIPTPSGNDEIAELTSTFNAMLDRLEQAFRDQRDFLDDAGHELRTPVTVIRGYLEIEGDDPVDRAETRAIVIDELARMTRIIEDLLVLGRAEHPDFLRREPIDLDVLTNDLHSRATAMADRGWTLAEIGQGIVLADRERVIQAVMNLVDNAIRHTQPQSRIELGSTLAGGSARLWVRDDGPGIPASDHERIFRRFARAHDGRRKAGTAGLGLAIVRAIAESHGGHADVASRPGEGAIFTITIPADSGD